jgi:hypothetical protein
MVGEAVDREEAFDERDQKELATVETQNKLNGYRAGAMNFQKIPIPNTMSQLPFLPKMESPCTSHEIIM